MLIEQHIDAARAERGGGQREGRGERAEFGERGVGGEERIVLRIERGEAHAIGSLHAEAVGREQADDALEMKRFAGPINGAVAEEKHAAGQGRGRRRGERGIRGWLRFGIEVGRVVAFRFERKIEAPEVEVVLGVDEREGVEVVVFLSHQPAATGGGGQRREALFIGVLFAHDGVVIGENADGGVGHGQAGGVGKNVGERVGFAPLPNEAEVGELHERLRADLRARAVVGRREFGGEEVRAARVFAGKLVPRERARAGFIARGVHVVRALVNHFAGDGIEIDLAIRLVVVVPEAGGKMVVAAVIVAFAEIAAVAAQRVDECVAVELARAQAEGGDVDGEQLELAATGAELVLAKNFEIEARRHRLETHAVGELGGEFVAVGGGQAGRDAHLVGAVEGEVGVQNYPVAQHLGGERGGRGIEREVGEGVGGVERVGEGFGEFEFERFAAAEAVVRGDFGDDEGFHVADLKGDFRGELRGGIAGGQAAFHEQTPAVADGQRRGGGDEEKIVARGGRWLGRGGRGAGMQCGGVFTRVEIGAPGWVVGIEETKIERDVVVRVGLRIGARRGDTRGMTLTGGVAEFEEGAGTGGMHGGIEVEAEGGFGGGVWLRRAEVVGENLQRRRGERAMEARGGGLARGVAEAGEQAEMIGRAEDGRRGGRENAGARTGPRERAGERGANGEGRHGDGRAELRGGNHRVIDAQFEGGVGAGDAVGLGEEFDALGQVAWWLAGGEGEEADEGNERGEKRFHGNL